MVGNSLHLPLVAVLTPERMLREPEWLGKWVSAFWAHEAWNRQPSFLKATLYRSGMEVHSLKFGRLLLALVAAVLLLEQVPELLLEEQQRMREHILCMTPCEKDCWF